jgi:hypothetical protein
MASSVASATPVSVEDENTVDVKNNTKALVKAAQEKYTKGLDNIFWLSRQIGKNGGRPIVGTDGIQLSLDSIKELHANALTQLRSVFALQRGGGGKGSKGTGKGNFGFKKVDQFTDDVINWLNDPRTTVNPATFQPFQLQPQADGTNKQIPVAVNTPLQQLITILRNDQVVVTMTDGKEQTFTLRGLSSAGVLGAIFSLYLEIHGLKGVPDPSGEGKVNRRFYRLDPNLEQHFGKYFHGEIAKAMQDHNAREAKKGKPYVPAGPNAIPNGMTMKLFAILKVKSPIDMSPLLKHPQIVSMINNDQELISSAVKFNKREDDSA